MDNSILLPLFYIRYPEHITPKFLNAYTTQKPLVVVIFFTSGSQLMLCGSPRILDQIQGIHGYISVMLLGSLRIS
jgi:hypothetical protein